MAEAVGWLAQNVHDSSFPEPHTPQDLPPEIFALILEDLSPAELWSMLGISRTWRLKMVSDKLLWRHCDLQMFKRHHRSPGFGRLWELSGQEFTTLEYSCPPHTVWPSYRDYDRSMILDCLKMACPRLERLILSGPNVDGMIFNAVVNKGALRLLDLDLATGFTMERTIDQLAMFPNLQDLGFRNFRTMGLYGLPGVPEKVSWGAKDGLKSLKRLELKAMPWRRRGQAELGMLNAKGLGCAAPNIENLYLERFLVGFPKWIYAADEGSAQMVDLTALTKLRIFNATNTQFGFFVFPFLPTSLEELELSVDPKFWCWLTKTTSKTRLPNLPNLRSLRTNFNVTMEPLGVANSMWAHLIVMSGCALEEVFFEPGRLPSATKRICIENPRPHVRVHRVTYFQGWSLELCFELLRWSYFRKVRRLEFRGSWLVSDPHLHWKLANTMINDCPRLNELVWNGLCLVDEITKHRLASKLGMGLGLLRFDS